MQTSHTRLCSKRWIQAYSGNEGRVFVNHETVNAIKDAEHSEQSNGYTYIHG